MKKLQILFVFLLLSVIGFGQLSVTVPTITATPGQTVNIPVKIFGAGNSGISISEFTDASFGLIKTATTNGGVRLFNPSLFGPQSVCLGVSGNVYTTESGETNYAWNVTGGTITAGGTSTDNTATVTWNTAGSQNISVSYAGSNTTVLPVTVNPGPVANVSVTASSNPVCSGTSVTFTATPTNGGTTPSYQWKKGGVNVGTNSPTYTYTPVNGDVITCVMTSSETCISSNPATSSSITMVVTPVTASISISASATNVTAGTTVTFTATPVNGGTSPSYQWKVNGANAGTNSPTFTHTPVNGDAVYCLLTSNAPCVTAVFTSNVITITVTTSPLLVTVSTKVALPGSTVNFPVKLKGASASGTPISSANLQLTYDPAVLQYDTLINFYPGTPSTQWYFSGTGGTVAANWIEPSLLTLAIPDSSTLFEIIFTYIGGTSALPFSVNEFTDGGFNFITTSHLDGGISSAIPTLTGPTNVCNGSADIVYTTNTGKTNYVWTVAGGTITAGGTSTDNTATVTWNTSGAQSISAAWTGSTTTTLPVNVNALLPVSVSITPSANPVCANTSVTFTATPANGGTTPAYQWKKGGVNVGTNSATYTYVPVNGDVITCVMTSVETCISGSPATSNAITMTVNPLTASISIAVSANPVTYGTSVTFTATPGNGGTSPSFQWKLNGANAGTNSPTFTCVPSNGDVVFCLLTSNAPCVTAVFTSNVITMTVNSPSLLVTLPNKTAMPGDILYFPVKLKGASNSGIPISSANIQITYDPAVFHYDTIVNFYASMPSTQWYFSGNSSTASANWIEPGLLTLAVPDSTTLFEIKFTYIGGDGSLPFVVNEFTNAAYDMIPTTHVDGGITQLVPTTRTVQNVTVGNTEIHCYDAVQVLTVAGGGTTFVVQSGGTANMIAGQKISFLPGTTVLSGGYLHGRITTNGQYCNPVKELASNVYVNPVNEVNPVQESSAGHAIRVYPNPTNCNFTLEVTGDSKVQITRTEIYNMSGMKVNSASFDNVRKHEYALPGLTPGMYFIHVFTNERSEILKIVKL